MHFHTLTFTLMKTMSKQAQHIPFRKYFPRRESPLDSFVHILFHRTLFGFNGHPVCPKPGAVAHQYPRICGIICGKQHKTTSIGIVHFLEMFYRPTGTSSTRLHRFPSMPPRRTRLKSVVFSRRSTSMRSSRQEMPSPVRRHCSRSRWLGA